MRHWKVAIPLGNWPFIGRYMKLLSKKLRWHLAFESESDLWALFERSDTCVHKAIFGEVLLVRKDGEIMAFKNQCPHQKKSLEGAMVKDDHIVCPFHKFQFSCKTGRGHGLYIDKYPIDIVNDQVFIGKEVWTWFE